ncbi:uncharacterized protein C1orf131 homolog [Crassostrea angulata]|uniref:uncharacterized protein C1orf131 homolog n=1 Tax=Magallana angulata TaxID=2784310 RepID=UPI0022B0C74F|nr:uncharacterized protein C1orf131 homolog [Crassostrea angulata]
MERETLECLQEELLKRLDAYGESVMDNKDYEDRVKRARKFKKRKMVSEDEGESSENVTKRKKRKKKKLAKENESSSSGKKEAEVEQPKFTGKEKRKQELKEKLGLDDMYTGLEKCQDLKEKEEMTSSDSKVVVYQRPKSKKKEEKKMDSGENSEETSGSVIDLKSARLDVQKFGIKGFSEDKKDTAMEALLVKLGAKPKKNKAYNYKEYQEIVKRQKVEEREKRELDRKLGYKVKKKIMARKKDRNDVGRVDGQVGKYKHGVQFVTKKDLQPGGKPGKKKRKKKF